MYFVKIIYDRWLILYLTSESQKQKSIVKNYNNQWLAILNKKKTNDNKILANHKM